MYSRLQSERWAAASKEVREGYTGVSQEIAKVWSG